MPQFNTQEGPLVRTVTTTRCTGCKYLYTEKAVYGHDYVTRNYFCRHPELYSGSQFDMMASGATIAYHTKDEPDTPSWCPYIKKEEKV